MSQCVVCIVWKAKAGLYTVTHQLHESMRNVYCLGANTPALTQASRRPISSRTIACEAGASEAALMAANALEK